MVLSITFTLFCAVVISYAIEFGTNDQDGLIDTLFDFENEKECLVKEKKSGLDKPCDFPFIYENKTYYGCSTYVKYQSGRENFNEIPWCVWCCSSYHCWDGKK